jgi:hypothetical protein
VWRWIAVTAAGLAVAGLSESLVGLVLAPLLVGMGQALMLADLCGCPRGRLRPWVFGTAVGGMLGLAAATVTGVFLGIGAMVFAEGPSTGCGPGCVLAGVLVFGGAGAVAGCVVGLAQGVAVGLDRPASWAVWSALAGIAFGCVMTAAGYLFPAYPGTDLEPRPDPGAVDAVLGALVWAAAGASYGAVTGTRLRSVREHFEAVGQQRGLPEGGAEREAG